jgi:hypothetical protein
VKLSEVAPIPPKVPGIPAAPVTANTAVSGGTASNVATAQKPGGTIGSPGPKPPVVPAKPVPQPAVDALAQIIKSAGLSPTQLNQIVTKAK